jgi:hypothetical protein
MPESATMLLPGMIARPTRRGYTAVDLDIEADPFGLTEEVIEEARGTLGCTRLANGLWKDSWKWRKEMRRDFDAIVGQPVFEPEWLALQTSIRPERWRMDIGPDGMAKTPAGRLFVWADPHDPIADGTARRYAIGIDVSEGVSESESALIVMDADFRTQVGEMGDSTITPGDLGAFAVATARYFNDALICCVRKLHGLTTIRAMIDLKYYRLWCHRHQDRIDQVPAEQIGWAKGETSDELMFGRLIQAVKDHTAEFTSAELMRQMGSYQYDETGRIVMQRLREQPVEVRKRHGDRAVAAALALQACEDIGTWVPKQANDPYPYRQKYLQVGQPHPRVVELMKGRA